MSFGWSVSSRKDPSMKISVTPISQLPHEDLEVVDQMLPPVGVPLRVVGAGALHEHRLADLVEGELELALGQHAVRGELRPPGQPLPPPTYRMDSCLA
jgi:hypothetical protein